VGNPGATLDQGKGPQPIKFGIYNIDPYVWFVHVQLGFSGYGFSVDDDTVCDLRRLPGSDSSQIEIAASFSPPVIPSITVRNSMPLRV